MGFIVDNGPSEAPSNLLVQMLLVRFLKFLDFDKVTQRSFAEYLSKRNFVERVHTVENKVLSDHGPLNSKPIHDTSPPGSKQDHENMESMANEVIKCIGKGVYNEEPVKCFRGVGKEDNFVFRDEDELKSLSLLSEERKKEDRTTYQASTGEKLRYLENVWSVKKNFSGTYGEDYNTLTSSKTAFTDNYSTSIFRADECWRGKPLERFDRQPLPDFKFWEITGELHYMSFEERRDFPVGPWDECHGVFMPEKVLDTCFRVLPAPTKDMMMSIALLAWVTPEEASTYYSSVHKKLKDQKEEDIKRETWKQHALYQESKETLVKMCSGSGLLTSGKKHELVECVAGNTPGKSEPVAYLNETDLYDGKIGSIPNSTTGLMRLSVAQLRAILRQHQILVMGTKEELITRVGLLRAGYPEAAFSRERLCILHMVEVAIKITSTQEELSTKSFRRKRKFAHGQENTVTTRTSCLKDILTPKAPVLDVENQQRSIHKALDALKRFVGDAEKKFRQMIDDLEKETVKTSDKKRRTSQVSSKREKVMKTEHVVNAMKRPGREKKLPAKLRESGNAQSNFAVGQSVDALWNEKDLKGTNWKPGWYKGEIQQFDEENDVIYIFYFKDGAVYSLDATGALVDEIIRSV